MGRSSSSKRSAVWCLLLSGLLLAAVAAAEVEGSENDSVVTDDCYERCSRYTGDQKFICIIGCTPGLGEEAAADGGANKNDDGVRDMPCKDYCMWYFRGPDRVQCVKDCRAPKADAGAGAGGAILQVV